MYARVLKIRVKSDRIDNASKIFEESVIPLCHKHKGFKGASFLADRENETCLPLTLWESEEDLLSTEKNRFFQEQLVKFLQFFLAPPIREVYEVLVESKNP
ncbi:MAG: antibiotic biosynthesis monooxygenase family protein [Candidatus Aminicenantales bacterium]